MISPGIPAWCRPTTPCSASPTRMSRMLVVPNDWFEPYRLFTSSLSQGTNGTPRHVITLVP